ncbi:MAG: heme-degrading domain-containing protein [Lachnospiraceae bacterium]|nr:heme-degrading domain-containing protein [Candidatus Colinaster scatohippi]
MSMEDKIKEVIEQEQKLKFGHFSNDDAYRLGTIIYEMAKERELPVTIEIRKNTQIVYHVALEGTSPDNDKWLERKYNLVNRTGLSSYRISLELKASGKTLEERLELTTENYAAHGGCFPINVEGTGIIGTVAVSGLEQSMDHSLAIEGICKFLGRKLLGRKLD